MFNWVAEVWHQFHPYHSGPLALRESYDFPKARCVTEVHGQIRIYIDGLMQKRRNSIANALELRLFCIKPPICECMIVYLYYILLNFGWTDGVFKRRMSSFAPKLCHHQCSASVKIPIPWYPPIPFPDELRPKNKTIWHKIGLIYCISVKF